MGCLTVNMVRVGGVEVSLTRKGGMTAFLSPICATDIKGRYVYLFDKDGKNLLDSDGNKLKAIK